MKTIKFAILFVLLFTFSASAQTLTGNWKANEYNHRGKHSDDEDKKIDDREQVYLNFRYTRKDGFNNQGSSFKYNEIQGLSKEQVKGSSVSVNFRIAREAGTVECEGRFNDSKGEGTFKFFANQSFSDAMQNRGFSFNDEKLFAATFLNLTVAFVDDVKSSGFKNLTVEDLFKAKIFKIDSNFIREMQATGFQNLDFEDLVKARIFKIDGNFVREVTEMGFSKDSFEGLVKLRVFKVTPEYLQEMKSLGFDNLSIDEITKLKIFKVTGEFMKELQAEGLNNLSVEEITKLRIFKIDGEFIKLAKSKGYNALDIENLVKLKIFNKVVK